MAHHEMSKIFVYAPSFVVLSTSVCWRVVIKHPFSDVLKTTHACTQCCFWIIFCSGLDLPHLQSHYSPSRVVCCNMMWAPEALLLPRLLTRFSALPQQLVKVTASMKIKQMHAAFMSFFDFFLSVLGPFPHSPLSFLSPSPNGRVKVLCGTQFDLISHYSLFFAQSLFLSFTCSSILSFYPSSGLPRYGLQYRYSLETSLSQFSDAIFNGPVDQYDSLCSTQTGLKMTS